MSPVLDFRRCVKLTESWPWNFIQTRHWSTANLHRASVLLRLACLQLKRWAVDCTRPHYTKLACMRLIFDTKRNSVLVLQWAQLIRTVMLLKTCRGSWERVQVLQGALALLGCVYNKYLHVQYICSSILILRFACFSVPCLCFVTTCFCRRSTML